MKFIKYSIALIICFALSVPAMAQRSTRSQGEVPPPKTKKAAQEQTVPHRSKKRSPQNTGVVAGQIRPRVFLNPGHGGHDSDDRPCPFYNEGMQARVEYYESDSNLKGFYRNRSGLGVFRWNKLPGILVENCFHDYQIERERLLNKDYCGLLATINSRSLDKFFNRPAQQFGMVAGIVRYDYPRKGKRLTSFGKDAYQPLNGVPVELCDLEGNPIQTYQIDNYNNGFYCFTRVRPGRYLVAIDGVEDYELEVKADKTTYYNVTVVTQPDAVECEEEITVVHSETTESDESAIANGETGQ